MVWLSLVGAMTLVGGTLLMLEDHRPRTPQALMDTTPVGSEAGLEAVLDTDETLDTARWRGIVIHHSGSTHGNARTLDTEYRQAGLHGLGYHFVVSNGHGAVDGTIEVGYRWDAQLAGAHAMGPESDAYNRQTIGICLIGDGERRAFTDAQLASLVELVHTLQKACDIPDRAVVLHRDIAATSSPGRQFPEAAFRERLALLH